MKMKSKRSPSTKAMADAESTRVPVAKDQTAPAAPGVRTPMNIKSKSDTSTKATADAESSRVLVAEDHTAPAAPRVGAPMKIKSNSDTSTKATADVESSRVPVTEDQIRQRAYEIFLARGAAPGQDLEDWLRAESELRALQKGRDRAPARSTAALAR
jgi:hypothetical protein